MSTYPTHVVVNQLQRRRECALRLPALANGLHDPELELPSCPWAYTPHIYSWGYQNKTELLRAIWWHAHQEKWWRRDILKRFRRDELALYESACKTKGYMPYPHDKEVKNEF